MTTQPLSEELNVSPYLVHFTSKGGELPPLPEDEPSELSSAARNTGGNEVTAFDRIMCILADRWVVPGGKEFGSARGDERLGDSQLAVCFSEIPLGLLDRLVKPS